MRQLICVLLVLLLLPQPAASRTLHPSAKGALIGAGIGALIGAMR